MPPTGRDGVPELPEVETIRRDLDHELSGRQIQTVVVSGRRSIRRHDDPVVFADALVGRTLSCVGRRGKYLLLGLGDAGVLVVHLGMSGQLLLAAPGDAPHPHTHGRFGFGPDRELRFVDPRTFGEMFLSPPAPESAANDGPPELAHLGLDPLDELKGAAHFGALLQARKTKLKPLLMDQRFLAGIGNIYSDEILFAARLRWDRSASTLAASEIRRLHLAMTDILQAAISHRGSSLADEQYRDVFGAVGGYQSSHKVYGREGEACPRCRKAIVRVKTGGRSTFLCPRCQA